MNQADETTNSATVKKSTLGSRVIGIACALFGSLIFMSQLFVLLGVTASANHANEAEAMGGKIANAILAAMAAYLVLYGLKKLKAPRRDS